MQKKTASKQRVSRNIFQVILSQSAIGSGQWKVQSDCRQWNSNPVSVISEWLNAPLSSLFNFTHNQGGNDCAVSVSLRAQWPVPNTTLHFSSVASFHCSPFNHPAIQRQSYFSIIIKFPFLAAFRYLAYSVNGNNNNKNCLPVYAEGQGKYELLVLIDAH